MNTITRYLEELATQGSSDAVAEFLTLKGHKGVKTFPDVCPVALYLRSRVDADGGPWTHISVGGLTVIVFDEKLTRSEVRIPVVVSEFIKRFDRDEYPALVRA